MLVLIYLIWGFTSLFAFWPALLKGLRGLAAENEQSKAFGFMEGGRGIINALHLAITLAIFNYLSKAAGNLAGLNGVITFYSVVVILLGILIFLLMKNDKEQSKKGEKLSLQQVIDVLKMPAVWILSLILCCTYTMNISIFYFTPYATASFGITATAAAAVTMMAQYIRAISSIGGVPAHVAGTAIGVVCTLGYLPEVVCPVLAGLILDTYTELGYKYYFMGVAVVMLIGIVALILWNRYLKASKKNQEVHS